MKSRTKNKIRSIWRYVIVLFALSQLVPSGLAFASDGGAFSVVICTVDGGQAISWEELTGEPSPYGQTTPPSDHSGNPCHACVTGKCPVAGVQPSQTSIPNVALLTPTTVLRATVINAYRYNTGPPLPSRAPPAVLT